MNVIVLGDIMLDINYFSTIERNAPEADIPIHNIYNIEYVLGGAANVAQNLKNLDINVELVSVLGNDSCGEKIKSILNEKNIKYNIYEDVYRTSTQKNRIIHNNQIHVRYDIEEKTDINENIEDCLFNYITSKQSLNAIVISDYNKGVLTIKLTTKIIKYANEKRIYTFVDPKINDYLKYKDCFCFKPNLYEASEISGKNNIDEMINYIKENINCIKLVLTRGKDGIILNNSETSICHEENINVLDVTGAGDIIITVLVYIYLKRKDMLLACQIANYVAGLSVQKLGNYIITKNDIETYCSNNPGYKILYDNEIYKIEKLSKNKNIVFTNGCFDILHSAHVKLLKYCKSQGDILVVGLNSDESIKRLKGNERPINNLEERKLMLSHLDFIDYIIIFNDDTPLNILKLLNPEILVKGGDYELDDIIGKEYCKEVRVFDYIENKSTTKIINKIKYYEKCI